MKGTALFEKDAAASNGRFVTLFVSYAHKNKIWMKRLEPILVALQYDDRARNLVGLDQVSAWHDQELKPGDQWDPDIRKALEKMDIFIPLVSHDFFASRYVQNVEMPKARERQEKGEIQVVPILLEDVNLREKCAFLGQFNPLPAWGRWWRSYRAYGDAFRSIDDGLWAVIMKALENTKTK